MDDSVGDINHHFEKVSDIVSGSPISSDHLDSEIHKAKHDNQETVDQLNKLDHESKSGLEDSEDSLKQITQLVGKVKDWAKDGPFLTNLPKPVQAKLNKAYKDLQNGEIDTDEYFDILSVLKKTKGNLSAEELNKEVPEGFIEYIKKHRADIGADLGVNISAIMIQKMGEGMTKLGDLINVLTRRFGSLTSELSNSSIKNGKAIVRVGKAVSGSYRNKFWGRNI